MDIRLSVAQTKPSPGCLESNFEKIKSCIKKAKLDKADMLVFSYGSLTGLNMRGLMENSQFIESVQKYNEAVKKEAGPLRVLLPTIIPEGEACLFFCDGKETVFPVSMDENPNDDAERITINGTEISVNPDIPKAELCIYTAPIVFCRETDFEDLIHKLMADSESTVLCINSAGFFNGMVFMGASFGTDKNKVFYRDDSFCEKQTLLDLGDPESCPLCPKADDMESVYRAVTMSIRDFIDSAGFPGAVLGMSGGIDSAVVGALAVKALGPEKVHCLIMPSDYSGRATMDDAVELCRRLKVKYDFIPIQPMLTAFRDSLATAFDGSMRGLTEENLQARIRGVLNMAFSNNMGHAVLVTGNKSELSVGYSTLYGDTAGALAPIMDLYKNEVYALAAYINKTEDEDIIPQSIIDRPPTAELHPEQKDSDSLPEYDILDKLLYMLIEENATVSQAAAEAGTDIETALKVYGLICRAEFKRRQYPLGVIVSRSSFAFDSFWDFPVMNRFRP